MSVLMGRKLRSPSQQDPIHPGRSLAILSGQQGCRVLLDSHSLGYPGHWPQKQQLELPLPTLATSCPLSTGTGTEQSLNPISTVKPGIVAHP